MVEILLPKSTGAWHQTVAKAQLSPSDTLRSVRKQSASKINFQQYLMLRAIYRAVGTPAGLVERITRNDKLNAQYYKAKADLTKCQQFREYEMSFANGGSVTGTYAMAKLYQTRCLNRKEIFDISTAKIAVYPQTRSRTRDLGSITPTRQPRGSTLWMNCRILST